ncbi:MAG TPA: 2,3,4,5-tetrahydropyridine-2,6-dicarboxylate N-succinyltransferase, partial [Alphaproteobacteria bacterium]|nr:2,3,4,5-tetrahydropyridine-2,6-dicarboxylate N-succinyltransferase [Alphaproteobacteria bacterium]HCD21242.1 2,3,4,5-tetrahydropyridine-2,6-dicarboxylate N-succinyltransferase [Alphaproteobacteria bacterium]
MDRAQLEQDIDAAWDARDSINTDTGGGTRDAVNAALGMLDDGSARVAEPLGDHQWQVNQWLKKAVLLSFRLNDMAVIPSGTSY